MTKNRGLDWWLGWLMLVMAFDAGCHMRGCADKAVEVLSQRKGGP